MTKGENKKQRKLSYEILGLIGVSAVLAGLLFILLSNAAVVIVEIYCFENDAVMTEFDWLDVDKWIFTFSGIFSAFGFSMLFLTMFHDRMVYIRTITGGIEDLRLGQMDRPLPLEGSNELTRLAEAINELSATQKKLKEKEQTLAREKEHFLRTLSHDIRTPLTVILAYAEYLGSENSLSEEERKGYLLTIRRKAEQIRDLTGLLLDGDKRSPERFEDARLLMEQLAAEFEEELEDSFTLRVDLSACPAFAGVLDVQELRRIFDNLSSNVQKYADPAWPVELTVRKDGEGLHICQTNRVRKEDSPKDSYRLGINSIRRIAQNYGGKVSVTQDQEIFSITVTLAEIL